MAQVFIWCSTDVSVSVHIALLMLTPKGFVGHLNVSRESTTAGDNQEHGSVASGTSNLYSQATAYAKLMGSPTLKPGAMEGSVSMYTVDDRPDLLSVLPVSAESAGLLPNRQGEVIGSDIVLKAVLEAEVARNAKDFSLNHKIRSF
ncbi:Aspartate carbamoyltransferase, partial [Bienertia sinuspersici]